MGPLQNIDRLGIELGGVVHGAQVVQNPAVIRRQLFGFHIFPAGFLVLLQLRVSLAEVGVIPGLGLLCPQNDDLLEIRDGFGKQSLAHESGSDAPIGFHVFRTDLDNGLETGDGRVPLLVDQEFLGGLIGAVGFLYLPGLALGQGQGSCKNSGQNYGHTQSMANGTGIPLGEQGGTSNGQFRVLGWG